MNESSQRRVVITGLGAVTPVGLDAPSTWAALKEGRSGIARITLFDPSPFAVQIAGEVKGFDPNAHFDPKEARQMDRTSQFAVVATREALAHAGIVVGEVDPDRIACIFGSAAGGIGLMLQQQRVLEERGPRRLSPYFLPNMLADSPSGQVAIHTGVRGHNMAVVSACATGGHAIGEAMETIRRGDADVAIAGGVESVILPVVLAGFIVMRALATDNDHPAQACKPFDIRREGFVMAEGCAVLILEDLEHARARGARPLAEVVGYGSSNDAYHMAAPPEGGEGLVRAMRMALRKAAIDPNLIDYINAHGTGTPANDKFETMAIKRVFGEHAYELTVSSTKSMTGHLMGAAGTLETMVCALAIDEGVIPPTINLEQPDPECNLDYAPLTLKRREVRAALSNSMGLGGHNSCVILRAADG